MYVARPGHSEAERFVGKYHKSKRTAESLGGLTIGLSIGLGGAVVTYVATVAAIRSLTSGLFPPSFEDAFSPPALVFFLSLTVASVIGVVSSIGYKLTSDSLERKLKPHIESGDVLKVDTSIANRWRNERASDPRIGQGDLFELQARFNAVFTAWRRDLTDS